MITPSFSLTATERVLPSLALDFTTATLDPRVTFTRSGNTATVIDSSGVIVGINANLPRFDYNPTTLACRGLLIEESRTNVLLNSLIDGTSLATQAVVVTAAARTLSFYGTGEVVLSGAASATVTGTGAYPTRTTFTFTPTVGALTLTVTGTVQFAQLELGSFATSFIPTAGVAVARSADVANMTGTNFSSWYNQSEGAFTCAYDTAITSGTGFAIGASDASLNNYVSIGVTSSNVNGRYRTPSSDVNLLRGAFVSNAQNKVCFGYKNLSFACSSKGGALGTNTVGSVTTVMTQLNIGSVNNQVHLNGHVQKVLYWPQRIINAEVQTFSKD